MPAATFGNVKSHNNQSQVNKWVTGACKCASQLHASYITDNMSDGEAGTPVFYNDEDELDVKDDFKFEDAGELDLSRAQDELLLTRVPKFMWEALANLGDDDEIQVGTLRVEGDQQNPSKVFRSHCSWKCV